MTTALERYLRIFKRIVVFKTLTHILTVSTLVLIIWILFNPNISIPLATSGLLLIISSTLWSQLNKKIQKTPNMFFGFEPKGWRGTQTLYYKDRKYSIHRIHFLGELPFYSFSAEDLMSSSYTSFDGSTPYHYLRAHHLCQSIIDKYTKSSL